MEAIAQKICVKTDILQVLVSKAVKGCSMTDAFPITGLLELNCGNNKLTVTSTDNVNVLVTEKNGIEGSLNAVVDAKLFASLVSKLTTPLTTLKVENDILTVNANGKYDFKLITEEDRSLIHMPGLEFDFEVPSKHISSLELRSILTMNKASKADMKEMPSIFNYYMDNERVLTTDLYRACNNPVKMFDRPVCLTPELVDLIELVVDENGVDIKENDNKVAFSSSAGILVGRKAVQEDLEAFPVSGLVELANDSDMRYSCVINKTLLVNAIDRICLFTNGLSTNAINFGFDTESITLTTDRSSSTESIKYLQVPNSDRKYDYLIDGTFLKAQISASPKEDVTIKFGSSEGIQIVCDNIIQSLGILGEDAQDV